jgi:trehalose 6-phosphate phosphatase
MGLTMGDNVAIEPCGIPCDGIPPPVNCIADRCAIFLDFDGTLMNLEPRPDQVIVDGGLLYLLDELYVATGGATALVSGRGIEDLDHMLAPLRLPLAGIHGAQRRRSDGTLERHAIPADLERHTRASLHSLLRRYDGLFLEDKGCAFAVHYRGVSSVAAARLRMDLEALAHSSHGELEVLEGIYVFELRPCACDKGTAVDRFMAEPPFAGRFPIFIGDDQTDLAGFAAVGRVHGMGIAVGSRITAPWRLPDPAGVRAWLRECLGLAN